MGRQVSIGRLLKTHGVRGELGLARYGDADVVTPGRTFQVTQGERTLELTLSSVRSGPGGGVLVAFEGVDSPEAARMLTGSTLVLDESEMPPPENGTVYWYQLLGLEVRTEAGEVLGTIRDIFETGANDIYVVDGPRGELLIPSTPEVLVARNLDEGVVVIRPIPGLLPDPPEGQGGDTER